MTYDYVCIKCGHHEEIISSIDDRWDAPWHCIRSMQRVFTAPMIQPHFEPFRAITGDRRLINSEGERRAFMRDFNLVEVGNDPSMAPPVVDPDQEAHAAKLAHRDLRELEAAPSFSDDGS